MAQKTAPKKAAKKAAKKVAKKAAKKSGGPHGKHAPGQDTRRAYEHLHRIAVLHEQLDAKARKDLDTLSRLAQERLRSDDGKSAADLLRAAEHLAFGTLTRGSADRSVSEELQGAIQSEFRHLIFRAEQEPVDAGELAPVYRAMVDRAREAHEAGAFHRALELARGAEALTHVAPPAPGKLESPKPPRRLQR